MPLAAAIKAANDGLDDKGGAALDEFRLRRPAVGRERYDEWHTSVAARIEQYGVERLPISCML